MEWIGSTLASVFRQYADGQLSEGAFLLPDQCMMLDEQLQAAGSDGVRSHLRRVPAIFPPGLLC